MSEGYLLRVRYVKRGRLAYLSHLETIRSMERVIRRAQLPYAVTEGFNPHMKVSFGPALPVGAAGEGEYLDLRLREYVAPQEALARMQGMAKPELAPVACAYVNVRADSVAVAFPVSDWRVRFEGARAAQLQPAFDALVERGYIEVKRKPKKRGRGPLQVRQIAFEGRLVAGPALCEEAGGVTVTFTTCAQDDGSLRPDKFLEAALSFVEDEPPVPTALTRTALRPLE